MPADARHDVGLGIDPQISRENAAIQAEPSRARARPRRDRVLALVDDHVSRPLFGLAGQRSVNVLELDLALTRPP